MNLIFDCLYGISGDMIVGALLDVGGNEKKLRDALSSLNLSDYQIKISKTKRKNMVGTDFDVVLKEDNHDHDDEYLFGNKQIVIREERRLKEVGKIIKNSNLTENAKMIALEIFGEVAEAEGKAHNLNKEEVIFHETGAMDSIIDIVSISVLFDDLKIENAFVLNLREGKGQIRTRVGLLPIPTPAVKNVLNKFNAKMETCDLPYELITPTGICTLAVLTKFKAPKKQEEILKIGYGMGKRNYSTPCTLKVILTK